jgi:hypothetical protein
MSSTLQSKVAFRKASFPRSSPSKIRFLTSPGKRSQKFFMRFPQQKPMFRPSLKNIFDFLLTLSAPSPIVTP